MGCYEALKAISACGAPITRFDAGRRRQRCASHAPRAGQAVHVPAASARSWSRVNVQSAWLLQRHAFHAPTAGRCHGGRGSAIASPSCRRPALCNQPRTQLCPACRKALCWPEGRVLGRAGARHRPLAQRSFISCAAAERAAGRTAEYLPPRPGDPLHSCAPHDHCPTQRKPPVAAPASPTRPLLTATPT